MQRRAKAGTEFICKQRTTGLRRNLRLAIAPIRDENLKRIVVLRLAEIQRRLKETRHIDLNYDPAISRKWRTAALRWKAARATWIIF